MGIWSSLAGDITVEITSAAIEMSLSAYNLQGVALRNVQQINDLTVTAQISRTNYKTLKKTARKRGEEIRITGRHGAYWPLKHLLRRPVLLVGMVLLIISALYLPTRVLFVTVQGNTEVPSRLIVEKAAQCGIGFGASRREVRSEKMKNALLGAIPELQWAGINTYGCTAVISVEERSEVHEQAQKHEVASIVAARDGIIQELTVLRGNPLCKVGQAVKRGQLLVSAYTDCGLVVKAESAEAEIMACTMRSQSAVTLVSSTLRGQLNHEEAHYSLKIGKNIINLRKHSGISDPTCVKMYETIPLMLPGGFTLPVSLIKERIIYYEYQPSTETNVEDFDWLAEQSKAYLKAQMMAGEIIHCLDSVELRDDICYFDGIYACRELIGQIYYERDFQENG